MSEISLRKEHLRYLLVDYGLEGFIERFSSRDSYKFILYLTSQLENYNSADDSELLTLDIPSEFYELAYHAGTVIVYKIVTGSFGTIIPTVLMSQLEDLHIPDDRGGEKIKLPSSSDLELWDGYETLDLWIGDIKKCVKDRFEYIVEILVASEIAPVGKGGYQPKFEIRGCGNDLSSNSTGADVVVINVSGLIAQYGDNNFIFKAPIALTPSVDYPNFTIESWRTVLFALISVELATSYAAHCRKVAIIGGDKETKELMDVKYGEGWKRAYYKLRDELVEPRLIE